MDRLGILQVERLVVEDRKRHQGHRAREEEKRQREEECIPPVLCCRKELHAGGLSPLRFEQGKQDNVANRFRAGQQHRQTIDSKAKATRGRHSMFQGAKEFFVQILCLLPRLLEQPASLDQRIIQLRIAGGNFLAIEEQLVNIDERIILQILLRQRDQLLRTMSHEERIE